MTGVLTMPAKAPQTQEACTIVAKVALEAMSRRLLTDAIERCEIMASRAPIASAEESWCVAADAFRAERRRRY